MEKADFDFRISDLILKVLNPHRESAVGGLGAVVRSFVRFNTHPKQRV